jgi:hypothetical protein
MADGEPPIAPRSEIAGLVVGVANELQALIVRLVRCFGIVRLFQALEAVVNEAAGLRALCHSREVVQSVIRVRCAPAGFGGGNHPPQPVILHRSRHSGFIGYRYGPNGAGLAGLYAVDRRHERIVRVGCFRNPAKRIEGKRGRAVGRGCGRGFRRVISLIHAARSVVDRRRDQRVRAAFGGFRGPPEWIVYCVESLLTKLADELLVQDITEPSAVLAVLSDDELEGAYDFVLEQFALELLIGADKNSEWSDGRLAIDANHGPIPFAASRLLRSQARSAATECRCDQLKRAPVYTSSRNLKPADSTIGRTFAKNACPPASGGN